MGELAPSPNLKGKDMDQAVSVEKDVAAALLDIQRERNRLFDPAIFSNPAWDIVLNLCAHDEGYTHCELLDACPNVSDGVIQRWIKILEDRLVIQSVDRVPGPPVYQLTVDAKIKLLSAFKASPLLPFA